MKDLIASYFTKWVQRLGLAWWTVDTVYYDDPSEIIKRFRQDDEILVVMKTWSDWRYGTAQIEVNLPALEGMEPYKIERIVVHELVHILVNEMREGETHHEERVVTQLTKAIFWVEAAVIDQHPAS